MFSPLNSGRLLPVFFCHVFRLRLTQWIQGISKLNFSPSLLMNAKSIQHIERLGQEPVGTSLWAAQMIKVVGSTFAFPKYCSEAKYNANSAIAALNKWLKPRVLDGCVIHSFRHSLRNRLRAIECPADIIDAIGSWTPKSVGHQYCQEHRITITHGCMKMLKATI